MSRQAAEARRPARAITSILVAVAGLVAGLTVGCSKPAAQGDAEQPAAEQPAAEQPATPAPAAKPATKPATKTDRYTASKDGTQVTLAVTGNQGEIAFELVTQPADAACKLQVSGAARTSAGDAETREDEHGELVEVSEYLHEGEDCWVSVSLARERGLAWVSTADCTRVPASCWLTAFGPLRKQ